MAAISDHLRALTRDEPPPDEALLALVAGIDEAAPPLRDVLDKAARGRPLSDEEAGLFFYGLHVLAAARDQRSFPALLRFLGRPIAEVGDLLGDGVTASLPRLLAGLYDDDAEALFAAAGNLRLDEFIRDALIAAAAFLTFDGRIPRERMHAFLAGFEAAAPPDQDMGWQAWALAIANLGLRDLMPAVERACVAERLPVDGPGWLDIDQDFRDAERAPSDLERFESAGLGYADDILDTLRWTAPGDDYGPPEEPIVNPHRDVGRNDPCPCGSGKKFKKCCLVA